MLRKIFLFTCMILMVNVVSAQNDKNLSAAKMIKTATTLTEAQQFEAAEEFFKKGLSKAKANYDAYQQAVAYEGLGGLYSKTDRPEMAVVNYRSAVRIYRLLGYNVMADVVESLLKSVQGIGDMYAGIEIGAKGIKLSVIEVKLSRDREYDYTLISDTSINTDAAALSYQSEKETFDAITVLWDILKTRYQIPSDKVHIVISSGLMQELDKYHKVDYFANIVRPKSLDPAIKITFITPEQEAQLSLLGIVPQKARFTATQLDVGSGNTKGGYFNANKNFVPVTFPLGTKSFQRLIESRSKDDINEYIKTAEEIWRDSLRAVVVNEFSSKKEVRSRDNMYISGGVVWAIASLTHPQSSNTNYTEISAKDIAEFRRLLINDYDKLINPDISFISYPEQAQSSLKNIGRVLKTYDRKALLAGTIWFDNLIQEINTVNPSKKFIYVKYAYVGWISGYIIKKVTQKYTGLVN
ncbi:MAG TPA: tetratricopeptide repeat protein [Ferruginibacter sp.]|jgi:tetratricopeptide (TPR) repeat protein|nr:tetratricopeptide repeat protein [Ferruginibacter sp.]